jgi:hypothetical protein
MNAKPIEFFRNAQLVQDGKIDAFALAAIAQGRIVNFDFGSHKFPAKAGGENTTPALELQNIPGRDKAPRRLFGVNHADISQILVLGSCRQTNHNPRRQDDWPTPQLQSSQPSEEASKPPLGRDQTMNNPMKTHIQNILFALASMAGVYHAAAQGMAFT